jgi:hypothetical protein
MKTTKTNPAKDATTAFKLIHKMDFKLLKAQKAILINMLGKKKITPIEDSMIEGILSLIDTLQDIACDTYGYDQTEVFNFDGPNRLSLNECKEIVSEKIKLY